MNKKLFTLVELLVVIGIIVVLSAILLPVVNGAIKKAEMTKAKAEITTLANAIKQYESTYGVLPIKKGLGNSENCFQINSETDYKWLIQILQAEEPDTAANGKLAEKNPRKIKFLEISGNEPGKYNDPWDNQYYVYMDAKYKGQIEEKIHGLKQGSGSKYYFSVIIYSKGPDKNDNSTDKEKVNKDNIYSVNTNWSKDEGHVITK